MHCIVFHVAIIAMSFVFQRIKKHTNEKRKKIFYT